jgi:hypothetical protein
MRETPAISLSASQRSAKNKKRDLGLLLADQA